MYVVLLFTENSEKIFSPKSKKKKNSGVHTVITVPVEPPLTHLYRMDSSTPLSAMSDLIWVWYIVANGNRKLLNQY